MTRDPAADEAPACVPPAHEDAIREQVVHDLYERSRTAIVTMLVIVGVIRWAIDPACRVDGGVRVAFAALVVVTLARLAWAMVPARRRSAWMGTRGQFAVFVAGVGLSSTALAAIVVLAWPLLDPVRISILAVLTSGVISGAVMSLRRGLVRLERRQAPGGA